MLKFIGLGSAFNTKIGNTSAFIKEEDTIILIDCGGTVFHRINELNLLNNIKRLHIIITHTHPDHIGSLGEVIFYAYYILKIIPKLYYPDENLMLTFLKCIGVEEKMFDLISKDTFVIEEKALRDIPIKFIPVSHLHTVKSYGLLMTYRFKTIYYSGDANNIPIEILEDLKSSKIDFLYQDTCGLDYDGNAHLSLNQLVNLVTKEHRNKVYCIHHDHHLDLEQVKQLGFNVPSLFE